MCEDEVLDQLRGFAERHLHEYGDPETLLAVIRARERLGHEPAVPADAQGILNEWQAAGWEIEEWLETELRQYTPESDDE